MNNYPVPRRESSDLQPYIHNQYQEPSVRFFDGVKRLGWALIIGFAWWTLGLIERSYDADPEKWNSFIFGVVVCVFIILLGLLVGLCVSFWKDYSGISDKAAANTVLSEDDDDEYEPEEELEQLPNEEPIFPYFSVKENMPEYNIAVLKHFLALKYAGLYSPSRLCGDVYRDKNKKGDFYKNKITAILAEYGEKL
jgi:hypothetical protein